MKVKYKYANKPDTSVPCYFPDYYWMLSFHLAHNVSYAQLVNAMISYIEVNNLGDDLVCWINKLGYKDMEEVEYE